VKHAQDFDWVWAGYFLLSPTSRAAFSQNINPFSTKLEKGSILPEEYVVKAAEIFATLFIMDTNYIVEA
jgi:hypothetical protein